MGEQEPQAPTVEQIDLGAEAVNQGAVVIPTTERLLGFEMRRFVDPSDDTPKWQSFKILSEHRELPIEPGNVGEQPFNEFCADVKAMLQTPEGQKVTGKMRALMRNRPLQVRTVVAEPEPEPEPAPVEEPAAPEQPEA
jgi:hypothetical protein